jgi:hypothetical protein
MPGEIKGIVRPPLKMPEELQGQRSRLAVKQPPKQEVPLLITLFAWYCFLRTFLFVIFALIVGIGPDSPPGQFIATHLDPVPPPIPAEGAFYVLAILYAMIGWRWITRDWRARWAAMFMSGATAAKIAIGLFADRAAGNPTPISPTHQQAIVLAILWNLLVCCYLAFYPGMTQAFKETPWE